MSDFKSKKFLIFILTYNTFIILIFLFFKRIFQEVTSSIPILTWHRISKREIKNKFFKKNIWVNDLEIFEEQIKYLYENNYRTLSMDDFYKWYIGKVEYDKKTVVIAIDDGNIETYYNALPVLKKYNFKATVFIIGNNVKESINWTKEEKTEYLTIELIKKIKKEYPQLNIQSHSYGMHTRINGKFRIYCVNKKEIENDFDQMEKYNFKYIAYPFGHFNKELKEIAKKRGYKLGFTFGNYSKAVRNDDPFEIHRLKVDGSMDLNYFKTLL